jgi:hypothetical protein
MHNEHETEVIYGDLDRTVEDLHLFHVTIYAGDRDYDDVAGLVRYYAECVEDYEGYTFSAAQQAELVRRYTERYGGLDG